MKKFFHPNFVFTWQSDSEFQTLKVSARYYLTNIFQPVASSWILSWILSIRVSIHLNPHSLTTFFCEGSRSRSSNFYWKTSDYKVVSMILRTLELPEGCSPVPGKLNDQMPSEETVYPFYQLVSSYNSIVMSNVSYEHHSTNMFKGQRSLNCASLRPFVFILLRHRFIS